MNDSCDAQSAALSAFEDEVIDRLFVVNSAKATSEEALGAASAPKKAKKRTRAAAKRSKLRSPLVDTESM